MASQLLRRAFRSSNTQILSSKTKDQSSARSLLTSVVSRAFSSSSAKITATFFPGDGIGPEIADSAKQIFKATEVSIEWEEHYVRDQIDPRTQSFLTWESLESVRRNRVNLKGLMATPIGKGHGSLNLTLRRELNLYANVVRGMVESLKNITLQASLRVAEHAFHYATTHRRERVFAIHKANIMQKTYGLFLKCCCEVAEKYPKIVYEEVVIDNCCMMLVKNLTIFDVLVMPNLYGDIISDLCAGLVGGLGLTPSCNIGEGGIALAEVVHGSAPDIAGKLHEKANKIQNVILKTIAGGKYRTTDLGSSASTIDFTKATCDHL